MKVVAVVVVIALAALTPLPLPAGDGSGSEATSAPEYGKHFAALAELSVAVAQAMPADKYGFRPAPPSMNFGELMIHITVTNYGFCHGLKDERPPAFTAPAGKDAIVKAL